ncbi:hypothetical protein EVAR_12054_1 [Eumeta japonica]|uniref:Uncharacterized protein n=1 Tax=Eumeta variegata TaxID=151549 RepID=A0A4C1U4Y8_EUMVA|nr:hypothetical protein EVAR_12054_1 [Eumeta japonica]
MAFWASAQGPVDSRGPRLSQQTANGTLLGAATLLGCAAYAAGERQQRRAFQDTKRSLRDKIAIERQSKEQVMSYLHYMLKVK